MFLRFVLHKWMRGFPQGMRARRENMMGQWLVTLKIFKAELSQCKQ